MFFIFAAYQGVCQTNAVYSVSPSKCPATCANKGNAVTDCPYISTEGCECAEGFVVDADGACVDLATCPIICADGSTSTSGGTGSTSDSDDDTQGKACSNTHKLSIIVYSGNSLEKSTVTHM